MLKSLSLVFAACALTVSMVARPAVAAPTPAKAALSRVMIQLKGAPLATDVNLRVRDKATLYRLRTDVTLPAARRYSEALARYQQREIAYLRAHQVDVRVIRSFGVLFNGFSATVPTSQLAKLASLTNVATISPDRMIVPEDAHSLALIHVPQAWSLLGGGQNAGQGLYIADVDTGIDMSNPCFRDNGIAKPSLPQRGDTALTNNKVVVIRAVGSYPGKKYSPVDAVGHGTFTAAIEACDYNTPTPIGQPLSGVAPAAHLMVYNINPAGDDGGGPEDSAIAAFTYALEDGADVVNFSYGSILGAGDESVDPEVQAINIATKAGLTMVVSAGNSGPTAQSVSSPSTAANAISVGASSNDQGISESISVTGPGAVPPALSRISAVVSSSPFTGSVGPAQVVAVGLGRRPGDDPNSTTANDFAGKDLTGKIALIQRGDFTFEKKINNAAKAGAIGAIIYDNRYETSMGISAGSATLPAVIISQADGQALLAWIQAHPDATVIMNPTKEVVAKTADVLADFSSRGYGPNYRIKPDLVAPGQDIYSAVQTDNRAGELYDKSGFLSADGTSFSAPHVTGAVALLLQRHPKWSPAILKAMLAETATAGGVTVPGQTIPSVMEVGSGLLNVEAAFKSTAYVEPSSASAGQANVGYGAQRQTIPLTLTDATGSSGTWSVAIDPLVASPGVAVSAPPSVQLASNGHTDFSLTVAESTTAQPGDYDGYVVLTNGGNSLHIPYFVHVASKAVAAKSVLLVDASTTRFQPSSPYPPIKHLDVSRYYEQAVAALHKPYTYWNEAVQGAPSLQDMKRASAVIYFSGNNLNDYATQNTNSEALAGPLDAIDLGNLHSYLDGGGKVFLSGIGIALSDPAWDAFVAGVELQGLSEYDNNSNDSAGTGGKSPPSPSAVVDNRQFVNKNPYLFGGLRPIDLSTKGDGAKDNMAVSNTAVTTVFQTSPKLVGVSDLSPFNGSDPQYGHGYGKAVLRTANLAGDDGNGGDVAIANSNEPSFKSAVKFKGRSVLFSFGFEGINDNTGYATRIQILSRIFAWFGDHPTVSVSRYTYRAHSSVRLRDTFRAGVGVHAASYIWKVGSRTLKSTTRPAHYTFSRPGTYGLRVQVTDSLGHVAVSGWHKVTVR